MKRALSIFDFLGSVCLCLLVLATEAQGQGTQSTILGTVTDPSGSVVTGATVTVKNEGTNFERTMTTDEYGDYRIAGLEAGNYQVGVTSVGFKAFLQTRVDLNASQIKRVDVRLELGEVTDKITVEGGVGQLETETATLSNVKPARDFIELPLSQFGRGDINVLYVTAGVNMVDCCDVVINGARGSGVNFTADGAAVNNQAYSGRTANGVYASVEAFKEAKIITSNAPAEYGQVSQVSVVTKSGENTLHGSVYWGNTNSKTYARSFFDQQKPSFVNFNMPDISNGGPVYIPHVYDGRNKTFYFFSYGAHRYRTGNRIRTSVPTPAFRQGDFSALLGRVTIVDPLTGVPFPDNRIPANRISPVSKSVQDLIYPDPNLTGFGDFGLTNNFYADPGYQFNGDTYSIRVDHKIANNNTLFVRVGYTKSNDDIIRGALKEGYGGFNFHGHHPGGTVVLSDTHNFSPTLLNEVKLTFARDFVDYHDINFGKQVDLGIQGITNPGNDPAIGGMPDFSFGGAIPFEGVGSWPNSRRGAQNTYELIDNLSWYRGRHTFKMGIDIRRYQDNDENKAPELRGSYFFDDQLSGLAYANFLLGYPTVARRTTPRPNAYVRSWHYAFYFQDDLKINQRVTLNVGLRYEYQTPWVDKFDRLYSFDPKTGNVVTAGSSIPADLVPEVAATLPIVSASQVGYPVRSLMERYTKNWDPRLGLAIRPFADATTVVRLGFGAFNQVWPGGNLALDATVGGPWTATQTYFIESNLPRIQFPTPFTTSGESSGILDIAGFSPRFPTERTYQWNASIGRQFWGTAIDVGYVGTRALNIPYAQDLNLLHPSTAPYDSALRPYPRFNSATLTQTGGSSIYNGFNIQADRRLSKGLSFNANYTWAKALTDTSLGGFAFFAGQNQYTRYLERADDGIIRRHVLRFSYVYHLPFGRGQNFLKNLPSIANHVLGGWQISGITTMATGARISPSFSGTDPANTNQFGGRPDRIADGNLDSGGMRDRIKSGKPIFDSSAFVQPENGRGSYGNSARNILTGPGREVWNITLAKNFMVKEKAKVQFRWDMFNAFNRANFWTPDTNISGGSFGLVGGADNGRAMLFGLRIDY
ncbi:MAG: TonB-dependent receptor [Acidobacteriota bacterium]